MDEAYNPLAKLNLARSIKDELLAREPVPLQTIDQVQGAGVYVIYYTGAFPPYLPISKKNAKGRLTTPIYVGKAIPKGGRKGGLTLEASASGKAIANRLRHHISSISEAANLEIADFQVRHLVVDDIWIPLGENMLIETFRPIWNLAIDGFGNNDPGKRRAQQFKSPWDVLHPGRKFAVKLGNGGMTKELLTARVADFLAGKDPVKLPKEVVEEQLKEKREVEEEADEI